MPYIDERVVSTLYIGDVEKEIKLDVHIEVDVGEKGYGEVPDTSTTASIESILLNGQDITWLYTYEERDIICNHVLGGTE